MSYQRLPQQMVGVAVEHAQAVHQVEVTPELVEQVKSLIQEE